MRTVDFTSELTPNGHIEGPTEIAAQLPPGKQIHVVLSWGISEDEAAWQAAGRSRFEAAYAADDSVYESLIHDPSAR
jgi:hypothetical protein